MLALQRHIKIDLKIMDNLARIKIIIYGILCGGHCGHYEGVSAHSNRIAHLRTPPPHYQTCMRSPKAFGCVSFMHTASAFSIPFLKE